MGLRKISGRGSWLHAALLGAVAVGAVISAAPLAPAMAQSAAASFSIPAGPLGTALTSFADQAGLRLLFPTSIVAGLSSAGLSGSFIPADALDRLLSGTGLSWRFADAATIAIESPESGSAPATDGSIVLEEVNVNAWVNAAASVPFETPGSSSYVSEEQLSRGTTTSLGDMFRSTPGVISTGSRMSNTLDLNIRGLQGMNRVATLVDGTKQETSLYRGYNGNQSRTSVDPELLSDVTIQKGPSNGPYGAGSIGGVVNMRTIDVDDVLLPGNTIGGRIRASLGSNTIEAVDLDAPGLTDISHAEGPDWLTGDSFIGSAAFAATSDAADFVIALAKRKTGNYFAGSNGSTTGEYLTSNGWVEGPLSKIDLGREVLNTSQDTQTLLAKTTFRIGDGHTLKFNLSQYGSRFGETNDQFLLYGGQFGFPIQMQMPLSERRVGTMKVEYDWDPWGNELVELHANLWKTSVEEWEYSLGAQTSDTIGLEVWNVARADLFSGFELTTGGQYQKEETTSANTQNAQGYRELGSLFANADLDITDWLGIKGGVRYDTFNGGGRDAVDQSHERFNPNIGLTLEPLEGLQLFATYAEGWRPPSIREMTAKTPQAATLNPNLLPEIAKSYELGFNVNRTGLLTADDALRFKAAWFDNTYDDYIIRETRPGYTNAQPYWWDNIDKAVYRGFELSGSYDLGWTFVEGAYTRFTDIVYCHPDTACGSGNGRDFGANYVPPDYTWNLSAGVRLLEEKLVLGAKVNAVSEQKIVTNVAGTNMSAVWSPTEIYGLFGSYEVNENLSINASVDNLFDTYYLDAMASVKMPAPGRTISLGVTGRF